MTDCSSAKRGFHSHDAAMRVARQQRSKHRDLILRVYRCGECHEWHLSSTQQHKDSQTVRYLRMRRDVEWP